MKSNNDTKQNNQELSSCCKSPLGVVSSDEGTSFYLCSKCKQACDQYEEPTKQDNIRLNIINIIRDIGETQETPTIGIAVDQIHDLYQRKIKQVRQQAIKETISNTTQLLGEHIIRGNIDMIHINLDEFRQELYNKNSLEKE